MTTTSLVLTELAAIVALVLLIRGVLRHACDPRRDAGRHRRGRHTLAHAGGLR
jgi:hypothetical protein